MNSTAKISRETLYKSLEQVLTYSNNERKRNFIETVELQVILKNYNTTREKRFSGSVRLPHIIRPRYKICIYGDEEHCNEARKNNIPCMSVEDLKSSQTIIRQIPRLLGPGLGKAGKFPTLMTHDETLSDKIQQIKSTLRVQLKKHPNINLAIGHVNMTIEQLMTNMNMSINFIIGLLRKKWQNIDKIYIKSTMGKSHRLY